MPEYVDPSGNTQQFRAFVQTPEPPAEPRTSAALIVVAVIAVAAVLAGVVWLALS